MSSIVVTSNQPTATPAHEGKAQAAVEETKVTATQDESDEVDTEEVETEGEESSSAEPKEEAKPKRKTGFQRMKERLAEKEREIEFLRGQFSQRNQPAGEEPKKSQSNEAAKNDPNEPKEEDFDSWSAYNRALLRYEIAQEKKAEAERARAEKAREAEQAIVKTYSQRVQEFERTHEDFSEVVDSSQVVATPAVAAAILESEVGPAIAYELAKNEAEFLRINALGPIAAAREIGKIEARLAKSEPSEEPKPKQTTKAPPPLSPLKGSAQIAKRSLDDVAKNGSQAEYRALRQQMAAKRA